MLLSLWLEFVRGLGLVRLRLLAYALALRTIDNQGDNILKRTAVLLNEIGITEGRYQKGHAQPAQPGAANAAPDERG